jgi:cell division protein FtsZ
MNVTMPVKPVKAVQHTPLATRPPVLKVIGLGGGGSNTINRMIELDLTGVEYIAANTDGQALKNCLAPVKIQLGPKITRGLGAGGNPAIGEAAAEESYREISAALSGADMVFLTGGMGGGTGTGSISVVARVARSLGAVTIAVVSLPFSFEVGRRQKNAREGLAKLRPYTDTLITVPNDRLLQIAPRDLPLEMAFRLADDVLRQGIQGISELITEPGLINVDFAHIRQMMQNGGGSILSIGYGQGENKAIQSIDRALNHPLLDAIPVQNATGIIANFTAGSGLTFLEVAGALSYLQNKTNNQAEIIPGVINDERMEDRVQVILVITGLGATPVDARPIEQAPVETKPAEPKPVAQQVAEILHPAIPASVIRPVQPKPTPQVELAGAPANLDLPAFLRKRARG